MIHLTRDGMHRDSHTMCGLRATSALNPHWADIVTSRRLLPPGYSAERVCATCFDAAGITPWPDRAAAWEAHRGETARPVEVSTVDQLELFGDVA